MKHKSLSFLLFICFVFITSCSNEDIKTSTVDTEPKIKVTKVSVSKLKSIGFDEAEDDEYILQIKDNQTLTEILSYLENLSLEDRLEWSNQYPEISSMVLEYDQAMKEAESYYDRPGGYEEFKAKYPNLYYPEEGTDFGAYLPFKDENISFLANNNGRYMVGDELKSVDIITYDDLIESGKADIEEDSTSEIDIEEIIKSVSTETRASSNIWGYSPEQLEKKGSRCYAVNIDPGTWWFDKTTVGDSEYRHSTGWRVYGKNKIKINFNRLTKRKYQALILPAGFDMEWHYEVSFRKKSFLGIWYNYRTTTSTNILIEYYNPDGMISNVSQKMGKKDTGWSSHDQWVNCNNYIIRHIRSNRDKEWPNVYKKMKGREVQIYPWCVYEMPGYWATIEVYYQSIGKTLRFVFTESALYGYTPYPSDKLGYP